MGELLVVFRSHWKWGRFWRVPRDPSERGQWQSSARASTIALFLWHPANQELSENGRKSFVMAIDPRQWNMELPQVLPSTTHCHPPCAASPPLSTEATLRWPCLSENLAGATAAGSWCQTALPKLVSTMCSFSNKGEKPPFVSRAGALEPAIWQQKNRFIVKVTPSPALKKENPQTHGRRKFSVRGPADSDGQIVSSGIWPHNRTVL